MSAAPVRAPGPTPWTTLLTVEAAKADTRTGRRLAGGALGLAVAALTVAVLRPGRVEPALTTYVDLAAVSVSLVLPVLVVLLVTGEWTHRTALSTFVLEPARLRVLAAKAAVAVLAAAGAALLTLALAAVALGISALGTGALGTGPAHPVAWDCPPARVLGLVLVCCLSALTALGLAATLQTTAGAVAALFALPVVVAVLAALLGRGIELVDLATASERVQSGHWTGHLVSIATAHLAWVVLPAVLGAARWRRRDVV